MSTLTWYHLFKCKGFGKGIYNSTLEYISDQLTIYHRLFNPLCENLNVDMIIRCETSIHRQERVPGNQTCTQKIAWQLQMLRLSSSFLFASFLASVYGIILVVLLSGHRTTRWLWDTVCIPRFAFPRCWMIMHHPIELCFSFLTCKIWWLIVASSEKWEDLVVKLAI